MKYTAFVQLLSAALALAAPTTPDNSNRRRDTKEYDIVMNPDADVASTLAQLGLHVDHEAIIATYNNSHFKGFSGAITVDEVTTLNSLDQVAAVGEVVPIKIDATRQSAPWGLQRISQDAKISRGGKSVTARSYTYSYSDAALGSGVTVYIADTGVYASHQEFGGRASLDWSYFSNQKTDGHGHGTHCAGTIGGSTVGIASKATLVGVKVLDNSGSGSSTGLIAGFDYIAQQHSSKGGPSVVSLSLGFNGRSTAVESALKNLVAAGVHAAVAAGNDAADACDTSPAALGGANSDVNTVGATNIDDSVAYFSNSGTCVDVYAPGEDVVSAYNSGSTSYASLSGTSMATPHVAGLLAYYLGGNGSLSPKALKAQLKSSAVEGVLGTSDAPGYIRGGDLILVSNGA